MSKASHNRHTPSERSAWLCHRAEKWLNGDLGTPKTARRTGLNLLSEIEAYSRIATGDDATNLREYARQITRVLMGEIT